MIFPSALLVLALAGPDYATLLKDAKLSLTDAIDKGAREVAGGTPLSAFLEDDDGPRWFVYVAKGRETVEVEIDAKEGKVLAKETLKDDDSKLAKALKVHIATAVKAALKDTPGQAVSADVDEDEKGNLDVEVEIFNEGEVTKVQVDGRTGKVRETKK